MNKNINYVTCFIAMFILGFVNTSSALTVFQEDFESGDISNWIQYDTAFSVVEFEGGKVLSGNGAGVAYVDGPGWTDYTVEGDLYLWNGNYWAYGFGLLFHAEGEGTFGAMNGYMFQLRPYAFQIEKWIKGHGWVYLANQSSSFSQPGKWYRFKVVCEGSNIKTYIDDVLVFDVNDPNAILTGGVGMRLWNAGAYLDNLKVTVPGVDVDAGPNRLISSEDQIATVIEGLVPDTGYDTLTYRWLNGGIELTTWLPVGVNGEAFLDLGGVPYFPVGQHELTLEVSDGITISTDSMILTVGNSAPHSAPTGGGVYEINTTVTLGGTVSDFDGDLLSYEWSEGESMLFSGIVQSSPEGAPVVIPDHVATGLNLGIHTITLKVSDGINDPVSSDIAVEIVDTSVPTLAPTVNQNILWPPNHQMVDILIEANASDNSGMPVALSASVLSNEPEDGLGDGDMAPDWSEPVIDQDVGVISLQLRAERSGNGTGRVYIVTIIATDNSGNSSSTNVEIIVPHNKTKK